MRKLLLLILLLGLLIIQTTAQELKKEDFITNAPKDYDKLLQAYVQMTEYAFRWKELYEKEAKLNEELMKKLDIAIARIEEMEKSIERLTKTIDTLQTIILRFFTPRVGLTGSYDFGTKSFSLGVGISF